MAINRLRQPEDAILSYWGFKKPVLPVLNQAHPLSFGLQGLWLTGGEANGILYDLSENGNTGTIVNGPTYNQPSFRGGYTTQFNVIPTANQYVNCGNAPSLNIGSVGLSMAFWMFWEVGGAFSRPLSKLSGAPYSGYEIFLNSSNVTFQVGNGGLLKSAVVGTIAQKVWHFVVATYDGTTGKTYLDGVPGGTFSGTSAIATTSVPLCIAAWPGALGSNNFLGRVDAVRVYNRALTAAEVLQLYAEPYSGIWDAIADRKVVGSAAPPPGSAVFSYSEIWG